MRRAAGCDVGRGARRARRHAPSVPSAGASPFGRLSFLARGRARRAARRARRRARAHAAGGTQRAATQPRHATRPRRAISSPERRSSIAAGGFGASFLVSVTLASWGAEVAVEEVVGARLLLHLRGGARGRGARRGVGGGLRVRHPGEQAVVVLELLPLPVLRVFVDPGILRGGIAFTHDRRTRSSQADAQKLRRQEVPVEHPPKKNLARRPLPRGLG